MNRLRVLLIALVALGVFARLFAVIANDSPHGDVHLDALTLDELWGGHGFTTPLERSVELYRRDRVGGGYPLDQHPPLSIVLAAAFPIGGDPYFALQIVSLLAGLVALVLVHVLARRILSSVDPWLATAIVATSFALADFAGNGSVYTLHAALTLGAIAALGLRSGRGAFVAGALAGCAYLTNYQALPLLFALSAVLFLERKRTKPGSSALRHAAWLFAAFALVAAPWWIRNVVVFGAPTFSVNPLYLKAKLGYEPTFTESDGVTLLTLSRPALGALVGAWSTILKGNLRFVVEQCGVWLVTLVPFSLVGAWFALRPRASDHGFASLERRALVLALVAHVAMMLAWPACKFRYLVPIVAPAALLAVSALERVSVRRAFATVVLLLPFLCMQVVLVNASRTYTTYDDGILVRDATGHRGGEIADRARQRDLRIAAQIVAGFGVESVIADIELAIHARELAAKSGGKVPVVVQPPPPVEPALLAQIVGRVRATHEPTHILAFGDAEARRYEEALRVRRVFGFEDDPDGLILLAFDP